MLTSIGSETAAGPSAALQMDRWVVDEATSPANAISQKGLVVSSTTFVTSSIYFRHVFNPNLQLQSSISTRQTMNNRLRSESWWNDPTNPGMTALYLERFLNYGLTPKELQSGRPIIGIAQSANDLAPCNRAHLQTVSRLCDGVRDAGGVPMVFPMHPLQESVRRPTASLDRNLAYLGLVEVLYGYPLDGVIFTTGCDKTTPAALMAAATTDLPSLIFNGGPMLNSYLDGELAGAGTIIWEARRRLGAGIINEQKFMDLLAASAPSAGHCNVMGTALSMNCLAEAMGMAIPGSASIPAPYRERGQSAYATGKRIVEMVREDLRPSKIITRPALLNAIRVNTALGGSTNCPPHLLAIAKHAGVELNIRDWETAGYGLPLLVNAPAGRLSPCRRFPSRRWTADCDEGVAAGRFIGRRANHGNGQMHKR